MEYRHEAIIRVPRDEAFSWWTDFTVDDHAGDRILRGIRTDLVRKGDSWTWTDEYRAMGLRTGWRWRVVLHPPQWEEFHGETNLGRLDGVITFEEIPGGTRVREVGTLRGTGAGRLLMRFLQRPLARLLQADFREHWAEFLRERGSA